MSVDPCLAGRRERGLVPNDGQGFTWLNWFCEGFCEGLVGWFSCLTVCEQWQEQRQLPDDNLTYGSFGKRAAGDNHRIGSIIGAAGLQHRAFLAVALPRQPWIGGVVIAADI